MPTNELVAYKDWRKETTRLLHVRSKELKALDDALKAYDQTPNAHFKLLVGKALESWKVSKGPNEAWRNSSRNGTQVFELLDNLLSGKGDTDQAIGVKDFMIDDMIHARLGVLFLFSKLDCDDSIFSVALEGAMDITASSLEFSGKEKAQGIIEKSKSASTQAMTELERRLRAREGTPRKVSSTQLLANAPPPPTDTETRTLWQKIRDAVEKYGERILQAIAEKLDELTQGFGSIVANPGQSVMSKLPQILRKLADLLTTKFLAEAAPFIGAGLDIAKGIVNTLDAGYVKFKEWLAGRGVELVKGHITTVVESIKRAMWMGVGKGLFDLLKGGLKLGMEFATAGAGAIVSLVSSIVETLVKTIWKIVEISRMRSFFKQAQMLWETRTDPTSLHRQPIRFNQWFRSYAIGLPALSVLALNSGITGNKMLFLQMFQTDGSVTTQSQFDKGVTYLDGLKSWGSGYLGDSGFSFSSEDKMVSGLLEMAAGQGAPLSTRGKVWSGVQSFLNT